MTWWNKYLPCPFKEKGRSLDGFDCWGLFKHIYKNDHPDQIILPGYEELYDNTNQREELSDVIFDQTQKHWVEYDAGNEFDAIILRMRGVPMHVGIVTKPGFMLHCVQGVGTVHETYDGTRWKNKVLGFYRYEKK